MTASHPTVVMLRPLGLGDFLTAIPAFRAIARMFPGHRRVLAAPRALAPLIDLVGGIDELHPTEPLVELDPQLHGADIAIDLHGRGPASQRILLATMPRRLVAFANADVPETAGSAMWRAEEHEVIRWSRMLEHAGIPTRADDLDLARPDLPLPPGAVGATLVHASAASEARRWPIERWVDVAISERAAGREVILTGDARDVERVHSIACRAGIAAQHVYAGRTNLRELAALVAGAGRVVCGDTGVGHLATAYRRPSVVLFGPISPLQWGPPSERRYHRALWTGRRGDPHAATIDPGLLEISVDMVTTELARCP